MLTLRSNSYEGRALTLTVEETGVAGDVHTLAWVLESAGGISSRYYIADTTVTIGGQTVYFYDAPYWGDNVTFPFPITTGAVSGTVQVSGEAAAVSLSTRVYVSTTPETWEGTLQLSAADTAAGARILAAENGVLGQNLAVTWEHSERGRVYTLSYVLSRTANSVTTKKTIHRPSVTGSYQGGVPLDYALAQTIPDGISRELEVTLTTYASDSLADADIIGQPDTRTVTVTVPEDGNTRPVITAGSCVPVPDPGAFVQSKTGAQIASCTAEGKLGATIAQTYLRCEGEMCQGASRPIAQWGQVTVQLYAQDSRGFLSEGYPLTLTVLPYAAPKLRPVTGRSRVTAQRCDADGTLNDRGAYLLLSARRSYSPVLQEGIQRNFCDISFRCRPAGGQWSSWQQILAPEAAEDEITTTPLLGTLEAGVSYETELRAQDTLGGEAATILTLASDRIFWHRDGRLGSLGFGEQVQQEDVFLIGQNKTLKVSGALALSGEAAQTLLDLAHPVGSILETVSPDSPADTLGGTWVQLTAGEDAARWRRTG